VLEIPVSILFEAKSPPQKNYYAALSHENPGKGYQAIWPLCNTDLNLAWLRGESNIAASQRRNVWAGSTAANTVNAA
jgi:hypothetical protein